MKGEGNWFVTCLPLAQNRTERGSYPQSNCLLKQNVTGETYYGYTGLCEKVVRPTSNSVNICNLTVYYAFHEDATVEVQVQPTSRYGQMHVSLVWDMSSEILYYHFPLSPV